MIGHEFDVDVLVAGRDIDEDDVLDALDEAAAANLVLDDGVDRYRFAHALVRATLQTSSRPPAGPARTARSPSDRGAPRRRPRRRGHRARVPLGGDGGPGSVHRHPLDDRRGRAERWRAGPDDALRWFESGLELLDPDEPNLHQRAQLLVLSGTAKMHLGDPTFRTS